jgi:hypothetical protein
MQVSARQNYVIKFHFTFIESEFSHHAETAELSGVNLGTFR